MNTLVSENKLEEVLNATKAVLYLKSFEETAKIIFDSCKKLTGAVSGYVALLSEDGEENELLFLDAGGLPCTVDESLPMPIRGLREEAYRTLKAAYDNSFSKSKWMDYLPKGHVYLKNVLFAPLIIDGKAEGLIGLANKPTDFTFEDAETVQSFGDLCAIALKNSKQRDQLRDYTHRIEYLNEGLRNINNILRHDLMNELIKMSSYLEFFKEKKDEKDLDTVMRAIEKSGKLIERMRELEYVERQDKSKIKVNVNEILKELIDSYQDSKIEILVKGELEVYADHALHSILDNLLRNAIMHSKTEIIEFELKQSDSEYSITIKDYGKGMNKEIVENLMGEYLDKEKEYSRKSLGLGLLIVRSATLRYGGRIEVKVNEPQGTEITIFLPEKDVLTKKDKIVE